MKILGTLARKCFLFLNMAIMNGRGKVKGKYIIHLENTVRVNQQHVYADNN